MVKVLKVLILLQKDLTVPIIQTVLNIAVGLLNYKVERNVRGKRFVSFQVEPVRRIKCMSGRNVNKFTCQHEKKNPNLKVEI